MTQKNREESFGKKVNIISSGKKDQRIPTLSDKYLSKVITIESEGYWYDNEQEIKIKVKTDIVEHLYGKTEFHGLLLTLAQLMGYGRLKRMSPIETNGVYGYNECFAAERDYYFEKLPETDEMEDLFYN